MLPSCLPAWLTPWQLLVLYVLGGLVGSATHVAYCWYDAGGAHTSHTAAAAPAAAKPSTRLLSLLFPPAPADGSPHTPHATPTPHHTQLTTLSNLRHTTPGPEFGLRYALNTPGLYGCSGAVAAICAYKATLQPLGMPAVGVPLPLPVVAATLLYCCLYLREAVSLLGRKHARTEGLLASAVRPREQTLPASIHWEAP